MNPPDLSLHWDMRATGLMAALLAALLAMTAVALVLRWRGGSVKGRSLAADFGARTLGWWLVVLAFMPAVLAGGAAVLAVFALAAIVAWYEFAGITGAALRSRDLFWTVPLILTHFLALAGLLPGPTWLPALIGAGLIVATGVAGGEQAPAAHIGWRMLGFGYCVLLVGLAPALALRFGAERLFFIIVVVQAGDVLQYVCGNFLGRRLLAPWLSPKKTWEGLLGGLVATALLGAALAPLIDAGRVSGLVWGLGLGLAGTAGGLAMSAVKRRHGAKDFGRILPGHGGLMDRLDSLGAALAVAYVCLIW